MPSAPMRTSPVALLPSSKTAVTPPVVPTVVVSRSGVSCGGPQAVFSPQEILDAWAGNSGSV